MTPSCGKCKWERPQVAYPCRWWYGAETGAGIGYEGPFPNANDGGSKCPCFTPTPKDKENT